MSVLALDVRAGAYPPPRTIANAPAGPRLATAATARYARLGPAPWSISSWREDVRAAVSASRHAGREARVRRTAVRALASSKEDLWAYPGTQVAPIQLDSFKVFHRLSFGHRNHRTYVVVLYDPGSRACRRAEYEVERLAVGLRHAPHVAVARLDVTQPATRAFMAAAFTPEVTERLPSVLLYPEGATGFVRYSGRRITADELLRGINKMYGRVLPGVRQPLELKGVPDLDASPAAAEGREGSQERQQRVDRLKGIMEKLAAAREAEKAAAEAAAAEAEGRGAPAPAVGAAAVAARQGLVAAAGGGMPAAGGYWSRDKAVLWSVLAGLTLFAFAWDKWLSGAWDRWQLQRRQAKRARGVTFDRVTDLEDMSIMAFDNMQDTLHRLSQAAAQHGPGGQAGQQPGAGGGGGGQQRPGVAGVEVGGRGSGTGPADGPGRGYGVEGRDVDVAVEAAGGQEAGAGAAGGVGGGAVGSRGTEARGVSGA